MTLEDRLRAFIASEAAKLDANTVRLELGQVLRALSLKDTPANRERVRRAMGNIAVTNH